jgi:uncharacterized Ntn-hydrolase superfamily protein
MNPTDRIMFGAAAALVGATAPAHATWSILIADTRTGEIALGSATCLTSFDLRENTPVLILGRAGLTAQSAVDSDGFNRGLARDLILQGATPDEILADLATFDTQHQTRQYGFIDARGFATTFSGDGASQWKGGVTGRIDAGRPGPEDDIVYAIQGNILTGAPVVLNAEQAVIDAINAGEDLAEALMLSMEAAYDFGGDGRCSCDQGATGCGSPPVNGFDKSADIGYMLVGRPGDVEGSNLRVPTLDRSRAIDAADLDDDGRPDLAVGLQNQGDVLIYRNTTDTSAPTGRAFATVELMNTLSFGSRINALFMDDTNADGITDIIVIGRTGQAAVFEGLGGFDFAPPIVTPIVNDVFDAVLLDILPAQPGNEIVTLGRNTQTAQVYTTNGGLTANGAPVALPGRGQNADAVPGPTPGVVTASETTDELVWIEGAQGSAQLRATIPTLDAPRGVASGDFNADGTPDFAAAGFSSGEIRVHTGVPGSDPPAFTEQSFNTGRSGFDVVATDLDNDGDTDLAVSAGTLPQNGKDLIPLYNDGAGTFTLGEPLAATRDARRFFPIDMNNDGLPEIVGGGISVLSIGDNRGTGPNPHPGFAGGRYHLTLNVAYVNSSDADPVIQLRDQYDVWRSMNAGLPDAVRSTIDIPPILTAGDTVDVHIAAIDLDGNPATIDPADIGLTFDGSDAGLVEVVGVTSTPTGATLSVRPRSRFTETTARLRIAREGEREIELLPAPVVRVGLNAADYTLDGRNTFADVSAFLNLFITGDPLADITRDGTVGMADIDAFLVAFES